MTGSTHGLPMAADDITGWIEPLFAACPDPVLVTDSSHNILWVSSAFAALIGVDASNLLGRSEADLRAESDLPGSGDTEFYRNKDGTRIRAQVTRWSISLPNDGPSCWVVRLRDVTQDHRDAMARGDLLALLSDQSTCPAQKIDAILALGRDYLRMPVAMATRLENGGLTVSHARSLIPGITPGLRLCRAAQDCGETLCAGTPVALHLCPSGQGFALGPHRMMTHISTPLTVGGERIGTLCFQGPDERPCFTPVEREMVSLLGAALGQQMASAATMQALETAAKRDWLTGANSARQFRNDLAEVFRTVRRNDATASLILFDIDHFKSINDGYGHDMGDRALIEIVQRVRKNLQDKVRLYRVGGEEFGLILPGTCADSAAILAESLRMRIAAAPPPTSEVPPMTASFGVAELDPDLDGEDHWLKCADIALYSAKNGGRNRVVSNRKIAGLPTPMQKTSALTSAGQKIRHRSPAT